MKISAKAGFTLVEIMIAVSIIALLSLIAMPHVMRAMERAQLNTIYENLRILESAKEQWAIENRVGAGTPVGDVDALAVYFRGGKITQVIGEGYVPNPVGVPCGASLPEGVKLGDYPPGGFISAIY